MSGMSVLSSLRSKRRIVGDARHRTSNSITLVGASAGSGKTFRLASQFVSEIKGTLNSEKVLPGNILAMTFTNKAADEIFERVRISLIEAGEPDNSALVPTGYVGTVNSVCGQLVHEYCFEAGISPSLNVLPAQRVNLAFSIGAADAFMAITEEAELAAFRLSMSNWQESIAKIAALARSNGISPAQLGESCRRSLHSFQVMLPERSQQSAAELDRNLSVAIDFALEQMHSGGDGSKITAEAILKLKEKKALIRSRGFLSWSDWAQLSKLTAAKPSTAFLTPVLKAARLHPYHPRLHSDIELYLETLFNCAAHALLQYESYKREHGFIDFTDQEFLLLKLLDQEKIRNTMAERIHVALIDEFQDTSPVQLAIFLRLAKLVKRSVWVGDEKQAIYGFRGTDIGLMKELNKGNESGAVLQQHLDKSYRSRPELVAFTNSVFKEPFVSMGLAAESLCLKSTRAKQTELTTALRLWSLPGKSWDEALSSLAEMLKAALNAPSPWLVEDSHSKELRKLKGADIAVLCRSNDRCINVSSKLSGAGLSVACKRMGLLNTPECVVAFAALRFLVDRNDTLAAAEILHFTRSNDDSALRLQKSDWLTLWLLQGAEQQISAFPILKNLDLLRKKSFELTPSETLELALAGAQVLETVSSWNNRRQRLANLDSMRGLSRIYEEYCSASRSAATAAGFVSYLLKDVPQGGEQAADADESAIRVLTYHGAKGLEWPLVILLDLDDSGDANPFGIAMESHGEKMDFEDPLRDRSIRCWPWPYGRQEKNVFLDTAVNATTQNVVAEKRERDESVRLLYVGMTRARDYLIFGARKSAKENKWIERLELGATEPFSIQGLDEPGVHSIKVNGLKHEIAVDELEVAVVSAEVQTGCSEAVSPALSQSSAMEMNHSDSELKNSLAEFLPYKLIPSAAHALNKDFARKPGILRDQMTNLGSRLRFNGNPDMAKLGEVMHRFLAADAGLDQNDQELRLALANRLRSRWDVMELPAESYLEASDRLRSFLAKNFPGAQARHEHSVSGRIGNQRINGRIDLLVELPESLVVIDHKTYPGRFKTWLKKACSHMPQLVVYAELVEQTTERRVSDMLIHMPVIGKILSIHDADQRSQS
jgi:ATP-dependent exoDNAse (exonuclease V) beta subunit